MCLSVRGIQYFSHQNPHLNHCFYRGLWILPWGTKIYAPSIQHKMEYRAAHIRIFGNIRHLSAFNVSQQLLAFFSIKFWKMWFWCYRNVQSVMVADNAKHQFYTFSMPSQADHGWDKNWFAPLSTFTIGIYQYIYIHHQLWVIQTWFHFISREFRVP